MTVPATAGVRDVPHDIELCYGSWLHCWWHGLDEPQAGAFRVCLECRHAYPCEEDLLADWRAHSPSSSDRQLRIMAACSCAWCAHDW